MTAQVQIDDCGEVTLELASTTPEEADLLAVFAGQHEPGGIYVSRGSVDATGRRDLQIRPLLGSRSKLLGRAAS